MKIVWAKLCPYNQAGHCFDLIRAPRQWAPKELLVPSPPIFNRITVKKVMTGYRSWPSLFKSENTVDVG